MGSILSVRSIGLGGATRELKRHSKIKVTKVSHTVKKVKRKWQNHKPKEIDLRPKKKIEPKHKVTKPVKHEKMKVTVKRTPKGYKWDKYGDKIYYS